MLSYLIENLASILTAVFTLLTAAVAYIAIYQNSRPSIIAYYQPSTRTQSIIDLVIENSGHSNAYDIKFSQPVPICQFGIGASLAGVDHIPTSSSIPSLAPAQRLIFQGGKYNELLNALGRDGISLKIKYKFRPPLWFQVKKTENCTISINHLAGIMTFKSIEQAVIDAIEGHNQTTIKDIRNSLQEIEKHLAAISSSK